MGLRAKAEYERESLKKKAFILLRKDANEYYSLKTNEIIDLVNSLPKSSAEKKLSKILNHIFNTLKLSLSINRLIAIILDTKTEKYKMEFCPECSNPPLKELSFSLDDPFIKELERNNNSFVDASKLHSHARGYDPCFVIFSPLIDKASGFLLFEKPQVDLTQIDKDYFEILTFLIELYILKEEENNISEDRMLEIEKFVNKLTNESRNILPSTIATLKEVVARLL